MKKVQKAVLLTLTCGMILGSPMKTIASPNSGIISKIGDMLQVENVSNTPKVGDVFVSPKYMYTTTRVNIRKCPDTNSGILKTLGIAEKVRVLSKRDGWCKTRKGWIKAQYLSKNKPSDKLLVTKEERYWLYQLVHAEAGCESKKCKKWITSVVFNLKDLDGTPNKIIDVIFYRNLFSPTLDGRIYRVKPSKSTKKAVDSVLRNGVCTNALFFEADYCHSSWHSRRTKIKQIDHTIFYK